MSESKDNGRGHSEDKSVASAVDRALAAKMTRFLWSDWEVVADMTEDEINTALANLGIRDPEIVEESVRSMVEESLCIQLPVLHQVDDQARLTGLTECIPISGFKKSLLTAPGATRKTFAPKTVGSKSLCLENSAGDRIREMTRLAEQHGDVINLAQGYPDFSPPAELVAAAHRALKDGYHQYSSSWGSPRMREAVARKYQRFMGLSLDPDRHITITCGATEAVRISIEAICNPGDEVIVFAPFYENYRAAIHLAHGRPIYVQLHLPDFTFDPLELQAAFQRGAKALILCNPSNPSGRVFTPEELQVIADLAKEYDAWVVTDEVYEHIVYPPYRHTYMSSIPDMFERTIACGSLSKTYSVTGWRLGYIIAHERATAGIRKVHDFLTIGAPAPLQEAAAYALALSDSYYTQLATEYAQRRAIFTSYLDKIGFPYMKPEGTYFCLVDISDCGFVSDIKFCHWLIEEVGVAAAPGSVFFDHPVTNFVRFHFNKQGTTLHKAGERLLGVRQNNGGTSSVRFHNSTG